MWKWGVENLNRGAEFPMLHTEYQTGPDRNTGCLVLVSKFPPLAV